MQIVVGRHSRKVDVIGEKASEVEVVDPRGLALQPGSQKFIPAAAEKLIREFQLIGQ